MGRPISQFDILALLITTSMILHSNSTYLLVLMEGLHGWMQIMWNILTLNTLYILKANVCLKQKEHNTHNYSIEVKSMNYVNTFLRLWSDFLRNNNKNSKVSPSCFNTEWLDKKWPFVKAYYILQLNMTLSLILLH